MIKRIIIVALLVATLLLTACFDEHETETAPQKAEARLVIVDRSTTYRIYADKETRVKPRNREERSKPTKQGGKDDKRQGAGDLHQRRNSL